MSAPDAPNFQELLRRQESLLAVIESISSELELRPLLTRIVCHACELLGADNGAIGLVDEERNVVRTEAVYHMPPDELEAEMPPGVGIAGHVLVTRQPLILNRYGDIARPTQLSLLENAVIGVPILWHGQMIGFFGIGSAPPRRFTPHDVEVLSLFAKHAAIAIENARLFARMQQALAETQLLYQTSQHISTAMDVDEVIAAYLNQVAERGRFACNVALYEFNEAGERVAVVVRGRWTPQEGLKLMEERLPYTRDALDPPLNAGQTITISNVHTDPRVSAELRQIQAQSQRPALAMIPLMVRGQRIGLVILSYPHVYEWPEADLRPYEATAAQLATGIDRRQQQLLAYKQGQQIAVFEERQRLARELHDSVTQLMFSLTLIAQSIAPAWRRDPAEGERRINRLLELSQSALAEMRALLAELRPLERAEDSVVQRPSSVLVQQEGLVRALQRHIAEVTQDELQVDLDPGGYVRGPLDVEEALYRIAQEALNNVIKHAHARRVQIRLWVDAGATRLIVQDDGVGFAPESRPSSLTPGSGLGLKTMRERAEALGGSAQVRSVPGSGTTVEVIIPGRDDPSAFRPGSGERP